MIPKRLKEARLKANLTQEKLGVLAGLEEATAYSRLSHYENGTHKPTFELACAFAAVLNVPECYFYIIDDDFAEKVLNLYLRRS
jgi:transcriptional regulator with XRE-family HTH domain